MTAKEAYREPDQVAVLESKIIDLTNKVVELESLNLRLQKKKNKRMRTSTKYWLAAIFLGLLFWLSFVFHYLRINDISGLMLTIEYGAGVPAFIFSIIFIFIGMHHRWETNDNL